MVFFYLSDCPEAVAKNEWEGVEGPQDFQGAFAGCQDAVGVALDKELFELGLDRDESQFLFPIDEIIRHKVVVFD
jgi:hypothetical protein